MVRSREDNNDILKQYIEAGDLATAGNFLKDNDVDINTRTEKGATILHLVAAKGSPAVIRWLLEKGADVSLTTSDFNETPYDLAARLKQVENAQFLRNPTLRAVIYNIGKKSAGVALTLVAASYLTDDKLVKEISTIIDNEQISYASLTGENFSSALGQHFATNLVNHDFNHAATSVIYQLISRKSSSIGYEQAGMAGSIVGKAAVTAFFNGFHMVQSGHWLTMIPDLPVQLSVAATLSYANLIGASVGRELGEILAQQRLSTTKQKHTSVPHRNIVESYKTFGSVLGVLYSQYLLSSSLNNLITYNTDIDSLVATSSPYFTPVAIGAATGCMIGGYTEQKTGTNLLPIAGMTAGAMLGCAVSLLLMSSLTTSANQQLQLTSQDDENQDMDIIKTCGVILMHTTALAGTACYLANRHERIANFGNSIIQDISWLQDSAKSAISFCRKILPSKGYWTERFLNSASRNNEDAKKEL